MIFKDKLNYFILLYCTILITAQEVFSISVLLPISIVIILLYSRIKIEKKTILFLAFLYSLHILMFIPLLYQNFYSIDYLQYRRLFIGIIFSFAFLHILTSNLIETKKILLYALIFQLILFYIQYFSYYAIGFNLNITEIIFDKASNNILGINNNTYYRASALTLEPGTYANYLFLTYITCKILEMDNKPITILTTLSLIMTFSVFGFLFSLAIVFNEFLKSNKKVFYLIFLVLIAFYLIYHLKIDDYLFSRFIQRQDGSLNIKIIAIEHYINSDIITKLMGSGLGNTNGLLIRDSTLLFNYIYTSGLIGLIIIIIILGLTKKKHLLLILTLFISKIDYTYVLYWLFLVSVVAQYFQSHKQYAIK
ncbi:hypothetical protein PH242_04795 [Photorhabdus bodei]|uniref:hypothetical protein n=1 Tax=Photorhabdus bodei TaxID=2029681 RepID=UPI00232DB99A|nr:hypothetical protein [Photorhabdus bodei]MDB6367013.1 hypothetical protein [Photorhabdus bodei]